MNYDTSSGQKQWLNTSIHLWMCVLLGSSCFNNRKLRLECSCGIENWHDDELCHENWKRYHPLSFKTNLFLDGVFKFLYQNLINDDKSIQFICWLFVINNWFLFSLLNWLNRLKRYFHSKKGWYMILYCFCCSHTSHIPDFHMHQLFCQNFQF